MRKISKKRAERLKWYSEVDMFKDIWESSIRVCCICNKRIIEPYPYCFAHILPKWMYPKRRLEKKNLSLVCSIKCHNMVDLIAKWNKYIIEKMLEDGKNNLEIINYLKECYWEW